MATKKVIKEILKEMNLKESDMQKFWDELTESNWKCKSLHNSGKNWTDLNDYLIRQIPTQKQRDIEFTEKKTQEEESEKLRKEKEEQQRKYYNEHFEEIIVSKIDRHENLTEDELKIIRGYSIEDIEGEESRWTRHIESIISMCGRFFALDWERGLTEYQENGYYNQPYEVEKKTVTKTITVVEWVMKGKINGQ